MECILERIYRINLLKFEGLKRFSLSALFKNPKIMKCFKKIIILLTTIFVSGLVSAVDAQEAQVVKYIFECEVIPYVYFPEKGAGNGFQVGLARSLGKRDFRLQFTYGNNKINYKLSTEVTAYINGVREFHKRTDEDIFTPNEDRVESIPDESLYQLLEDAGFKHYKPDDGTLSTSYCSLELLKTSRIGKNWNLDYGLGSLMGLMNRNEFAGLVNAPLYYPLSGNYVKTNVNFRISAKYLYYGFTSRIAVNRKITDRFLVGVSGGTKLLMGKRSVDMLLPYLSVMASFQIN